MPAGIHGESAATGPAENTSAAVATPTGNTRRENWLRENNTTDLAVLSPVVVADEG
ncbi:hypothetical protein FRUB_01140 [Fimbriiglobus ruber]|uniref:Uncharacterized protein n=1 Tax=Fimbriiglobus ruber TaxID=1908690 RepID=A0A225E1J9_9BACT|nr:hypothetical protein FRUB_01140 [Fimbriiglobus ruber]